MAADFFYPTLQPRDGAVLHVLTIERISTVHQDERSLDDQQAYSQEWLRTRYAGPIEFVSIASRASGELLDRAELQQLEEAIESDRFDAVVCEDLGRVCRRARALDLCECAEDHNVRLFAINDNIDTGAEGWRTSAFFAAMRHEAYNADTAKRIRRTQRNRFIQGGIISHLPYGYFKPQGAKHDSEITKTSDADEIYREWFQRLEGGASFAEVADWLNSKSIPVGTGTRAKRWNDTTVSRTTRNPILKGKRERNRKKSKRINKTGQRRSVPAPPDELLVRDVPHLAFFEPDYYDYVIQMVHQRNAAFRRAKDGQVDPLRGRPKRRSTWPGQCVQCGVCGSLFVYGGHGVKSRLMCSAVHEYCCWNAVSFSGPLAAERIGTRLMALLDADSHFETVWQTLVWSQVGQLHNQSDLRQRQLQQRISEIDRKTRNLIEFIQQGNGSKAIGDSLHNLEQEKVRLSFELQQIVRQASKLTELPDVDQLRVLAHKAMALQANDPCAFARIMRLVVPSIKVFPHQLIDSTRVILRAECEVAPLHLVEETELLEDIPEPPTMRFTIDLFDPPQRVAIMTDAVRLTEVGLKQREIAKRCGVTLPVVQRSLALHRDIQKRGIVDPYQRILTPPKEGKLRRHRHPRYIHPTADGDTSPSSED